MRTCCVADGSSSTEIKKETLTKSPISDMIRKERGSLRNSSSSPARQSPGDLIRNSQHAAKRERRMRSEDELLEAVADARNGGSARDLDIAISKALTAGVESIDIDHAREALQEVVSKVAP